MPYRTPIALITGALGSGKTTLLRQVLSGTDRRLAVLMNEFGEIAIDSRILPGDNLRIIELAGGCVCCELAGEFEAAVTEIIERFQPELIVVEATGVAEADALAYEVQDNLPQVRLDSVINLVDAYASIEHPEIGYSARSQLQQADIILINKIDLVEPSAVAAVENQVRKYNDRAFLLRCIRCGLDPRILFGLDIKRRDLVRTPHSGQSYDSFAFTTDRILGRAKFEQLIADLPPAIYRAKGFVLLDDDAFLFNYVAGRMDLEPFPSDKTQLVFIGPQLEPVQIDILDKLRGCEV
ncbi:MAG: GTP-binding protein [Acidobacteriia bacterium]|nr:GTP-binding protein [Terriglobia bacterium]